MSQGRFIVKFATTEEELQAVYRLRYENFILEHNPENVKDAGLDVSPEDKYAKHVIVVDSETGELCGCYRMLATDLLPPNEKFFCEHYFHLDKLRQTGQSICEFSRAVVRKEYRGGKVLLLLWGFLFRYVLEHNYRYVIGKVTFHGTDRMAFQQELSYLAHNRLADPKWDIYPLQDLPPMELVDTSDLSEREVMHRLPALMRAYLAMGAMVVPQPYSDFDVGTTEVFTMLDTTLRNKEYVDRLIKNS